jgi:Arc-like DNA binding domain
VRDPADSVIADAVSLTLRLPPVLHAELKTLCEESGNSMNSTIVAAVRDMLDARHRRRHRRRAT